MSSVYFQIGQATVFPLAPEFLAIVEEVNKPENVSKNIVLAGHTCKLVVFQEETKAKFGDNQRLSNARAQAVFDALKNAGVNPNRISIIQGFSDTTPSEETLVNVEKDRRVVVTLV